MKQQFLNILILVSLGIGGVAMFQPKVVSFGAALLGIRLSADTAEPPSTDEFEPEDDYSNLGAIPDVTTPPVFVYSDSPDFPAVTEPTPITGSDFAFADLSVPLAAETTTATVSTANYTSSGETENGFAVVSQNLPSAEPLEEIVLYEPPPSEPKPMSGIARSHGRSIAAPPPVTHPPASNPPVSANPAVPADIGGGSRFHVDANLVEIVPLPGAETVARVGTEIILGCDILPEAKKIAYFDTQDRLKKMPPEERQKITGQELQELQEMIVQQVFPMILDGYVRSTLLYCDFAGGRKKEEIQMWEKRLGDSFEEHEFPRLMKLFGVGNRMELNTALEKRIGSSVEREKALFIRKTIGQIMMSNTVKEAEGECTHEEMFNYYNEHKAEFFHRARARWLQLTVNITPSFSKEQAKEKIVWMGNHVAGGIPFEQVARDHSDGLTAKNGGFNDWVAKGSLVSDTLERAIFQGQIGSLSPIIEDRNAFHIVKVLEREEEYYTPFLQSQTEIKKKIKDLRRNKKEAEYYVELFRKFQPEIYQNNVTNFSKPESRTALPQGTGTSLHAR